MVDFFKFTEQVNLLHPTALLAMKLRPKYVTLRQSFYTPLYTKAQHSIKNEQSYH